jgi:hypothetical protein
MKCKFWENKIVEVQKLVKFNITIMGIWMEPCDKHVLWRKHKT